VNEFTAQAAFDPAAVGGEIQGADFHQGNYEGNKKGKEGVHQHLLINMMEQVY
jgi:hypothetical protein